MAILLGSSFRLLRFRHLTHHRYNRHPMDCPDFFGPARLTRFAACTKFYAELLLGTYLMELLLPLVFLLPRPAILILLRRAYRGEGAQNRLDPAARLAAIQQRNGD